MSVDKVLASEGRFSKSLACGGGGGRSSGKTRRRPACNRAAWRIAGAGGPMAGCQGPFARKNPIHGGAQRVNPKIFRPGGKVT
ncbi:unnamed protein product [Macrosiphum euphorbiae]|uniref:Uncharacterized protein n=1 Tax=Macrosiphum euphorbiae TaxID=13131 RepID=A0AAV0XDQ3_9HEMI|nr:unnamed protein product [Macrosiphum euphorbiae]